MKRTWNRLLAATLAVVLAVGMLPAPAYASPLTSSTTVENAALLDALRAEYGDDAESLLAVLEQYGLLDENGALKTSEKIVMDGRAYTLEELETILDDPSVDLSRVVTVDGDAVTLENLKLMVEIERELARIQAIYFTDRALTDAQRTSLMSFYQAARNGDVLLYAGEAYPSSRYDHAARVSMSVDHAAVTNGASSVNVTFALSRALDYEVSLSYQTLGGSALAGTHYTQASGTITFQIGETSKEVTIPLRAVSTNWDTTDDLWNGKRTFYIRAYDPVDILFSDGSGAPRATLTQEIRISMDYNGLGATYEASVTNDIGARPYHPLDQAPLTLNGTTRYMLNKGYLNKVTISAEVKYGTPNGFYNAPYYEYLQRYDVPDETACWHSTIYYRGYSIQVSGPLSYASQMGYQISPLKGYTYNDSTQGDGWSFPDVTRTDERPNGCGTPDDPNYIGAPFSNTGDIHADVATPPEQGYTLTAEDQKRLTGKDNGVKISAWARKSRVVGMVCSAGYSVSSSTNSALWIDTQPARRDPYWEIYGESSDFLNEIVGGTKPLDEDWVGENPVTVRFTFNDTDLPAVTSITAPQSVTFYAGDVIPITVAFDEPVKASAVDFRVAGSADGSKTVKLSPADGDLVSERITFLYTVGATDTATLYPAYLSYADLFGNAGTTLDGNSNFDSLGAKTLCAGKIKAPLPQDALGELAVKMSEDETKKSLVTLTIPLSGPHEAVQDILALGKQNSEDERFYLNTLQVSLNGGAEHPGQFPFYFDDATSPTKLECVIPLDYNTSEAPLPFTAELWWDGAILLGKTASDAVPSTVFATASDFSILPSPDFETYAGEGKTLFYQDFLGEGKTPPSLSLDLNVIDPAITYQQHGDFTWTSSNPEVATVSNALDHTWGQITLTGKSGRASFTLTANNGGVEGKAVTSSPTATLTVDMGGAPFLSVPEAQRAITITKGQSATLNWTSNLSEKSEGETNFQVALFPASDYVVDGEAAPSIRDGAEVLWETTVTGTADAPASSVAIPAEQLTELGTPAYAARVSSGGLSLIFTIGVKSPPAGVRLERPESLYILDSKGALDIHYTLTDFVLGNEQTGAYELYITSSNGGKVATITNLDQNPLTQTNAGLTGAYTLKLPKVELSGDPNSYRNVYTVTLKAKNGLDTNWSYDSFLLYVYSDQALKLWIDGTEAGDSLTMSNVPAISALYAGGSFADAQAAVLEMARNINLKKMISINYGDYAWGALCDRIKWSVSDSMEKGRVATVNYNRGGLYENIDYFDRDSYAPTDQFILSGLASGTAQITVEHALTGDTAGLSLNVEALTDRLYLFQCYPKAETTLTYTNGGGETKTVTSESDGRAAIYEESGIASDVYCRSEAVEDGQDVVYLGTVYRENLTSGERDSTRLELYPLNNLQLRRAAQATLYFKKPDGATPYTGQLTFRGGVYREGEYAANAQFAFQAETTVSRDGTEDQTVQLGADGKLTVTMDITQFTTATYPDPVQDPVQAGENIQYMLELRFTDDDTFYQPIFTSVDATLNEADITSSGESIYTLVEADAATPFLAGQTVRYAEKGDRFSVLGSKGNVGPSTSYPTAFLSTSVLWWGDELPDSAAETTNSISMKDGSGAVLPGQSLQNTLYPFSTMLMTTHTVRMDESGMAQLRMKTYDARSLSIILSRDGSNVYKTSTLPFKLVNMIGAPASETAESLYEAMNQLGGVQADGSKSMKADDALLWLGMSMLASDSNYSTEKTGFHIKLSPTEDPMRFLGFISVSAGNMESGHNVTGVYPADDSKGGNKATSDFDYMPSIISVAKMCTGKYLSGQESDAMDSIEGKGVRNINFDLGGYVESEILFNTTTGKWEIHALNGGFHAGGGLGYTWNNSMFVGPVPVVISATLGATLEFSMDMQRGNYTYYPGGISTADSPDAVKLDLTGTDYLTELRIYMYARVFAGIGFDISIVALKVGIFGQVNFDMRTRWLTRPYLEEDEDGVQRTISKVGDYYDTLPLVNGLKLNGSGMVGVEFFVKFLFISYEKIIASQSFTAFSYDDDIGWLEIDKIWAANGKINSKGINRMSIDGEDYYEVDLGAQVEDRSYLSSGTERTWGSPSNGGISLFSLDAKQGVAETLQTNAYPYAAPVVSDDGKLMVYLSDMASPDVEKTRVVWSKKSNGQFPEGLAPIDDGGYGDSALQLAGTGDQAVAVWVRQSTAIQGQITDYENGQPIYAPLSAAEQVVQTNSTEIMAAVWNGSGWTAHQLTANGTPDLAPVVAFQNGKAIVAWRSVIPTSGDSVTTFDQKDNILYCVYDGNEWSDTRTLYDGSSTAGAVKGLQIAMMTDGTAAVAYTLDTASGDGTNSTAGWETLAAIIPADGSENGVRTLRLTDDQNLDENPQVAAVKFHDDHETERFIVGWHTQRLATTSGSLENDIRLTAFDADGALYNGLPDSVGIITAGTDLTVGSNFHFAKNAGSIRDLALVWTDSVAPEHGGSAQDLTAAYQEVGYDVLKAVKFIDVDGQLSLSAAVEVANLGEDSDATQNTLVDHFDAWMEDGAVKSILLGTSYNGAKKKTVEVEVNGETTPMTILVADPVSGMYTATGEFINRIEVPAAAFDYDDIYLNTDIPVQFTVRNSGAAPIERLTVTLGNGQPQIFDSLDLLPNQTVILTTSCPVEEQVSNVDYTVAAEFQAETLSPHALKAYSESAEGCLYLDVPDVGISSMRLANASAGKRTLQYSLYNQLAAPLRQGRDTVKVGFYADPSHTQPLLNADSAELVLTINDKADLDLVNSGGYSGQVTVDLTKVLAPGLEIPDTGFPVYAMTWIEQTAGSKSGIVAEYHTSNNYAQITCQSLLKQYNGEAVHIESSLVSNETGTNVTVTLQNNSLLTKQTGNLVVTLLDHGGKVLAQQQSYSEHALNHGLIALGMEETAEQHFTFPQQGASVSVIYSDLVLQDTANVSLASLGLSGVSLTQGVDETDPGIITYTGSGDNLSGVILTVATQDPKATITVNGQPYTQAMNLSLNPGENTIDIVVTAQDKITTATYRLIVESVIPTSGSGSSSVYPVNVVKPEHGSVTTRPSRPAQGSTVTITAKPDNGYQVGSVTVTQTNGRSVDVTLHDSGVYTFSMPAFGVQVNVSFVPMPSWENPFHDVAEKDWYYEAVKYVNERGLMSGTGDATFGPRINLSRGMIAQILYRLENALPVTAHPFADVAADTWYSNAVNWAAREGLVSGYGDRRFGPGDDITREQLALILHRYAKYKSHDTSVLGNLSGFPDGGAVSNWAGDSVSWAVGVGLISGKENGTLDPGGPATRAEAAKILMDFLSR